MIRKSYLSREILMPPSVEFYGFWDILFYFFPFKIKISNLHQPLLIFGHFH